MKLYKIKILFHKVKCFCHKTYPSKVKFNKLTQIKFKSKCHSNFNKSLQEMKHKEMRNLSKLDKHLKQFEITGLVVNLPEMLSQKL